MKIPRASISCALIRDPDYLALSAELHQVGHAAMWAFVGLVCAGKDRKNGGKFDESDEVLGRMLGMRRGEWRRYKAILLNAGGDKPFLTQDGEYLVVRNFDKWNPPELRGGARAGAGRPKVKPDRNQNDSPPSPFPSPSPLPSPKGTGKGIRPAPSRKASGPVPVPPDLMDLELYASDPKLCAAWPSFRKAQELANPAVDILAETRKAHGWEVANPSKRKRSRTPFLSRWYAKAQDSRGGNGRQGQADMWDEARRLAREEDAKRGNR